MKPRFFRYCKNCRFYKRTESDWGSNSWCLHPANITHGQSHNGPTTTYIYEPKVKNKDARCADYVEKPPKMKRIKTFINYVLQRKYE